MARRTAERGTKLRQLRRLVAVWRPCTVNISRYFAIDATSSAITWGAKILYFLSNIYLSLRLIGHFPGEPELAGVQYDAPICYVTQDRNIWSLQPTSC